MRKTLLGLGVLSAILAGVLAVGLASAQTSTPEPSATGTPENLATRFKEGLAGHLGISVDELNAALDATQYDLIDQAVADGKITEAEAERLKENVDAGHNLLPFAGARGRIAHGVKIELVQSTADVLGVDVSVVTDSLKNGDSLADIANANGMDTADFETALLADIKSKLDEKVSNGDITQEQADRLYDCLSENIDDIVNHTRGDFGGGFFGGPGRGHGPGFDGPRFWFGGPQGEGDAAPSESSLSPTSF